MIKTSDKRYRIESVVLALDTPVLTSHTDVRSGKRYVLTIRDLPAEEKPREKMLSRGSGALSPQELLAVLLGTGTRKEGVLEMTSRIIQEYGEKNALYETDAKQMARDLDVPLTKALQIAAAGELGRRFFKREQNGAPVIRTAREVFEYVVDMRNLSKEHLRGIYLNAHYQIIRDEIISIGTVDANVIHPREVFRPALACSAVAVILVHNHPSGALTPSKEDIVVTHQIAQAGKMMAIELIDHVIVAADGFTSIPLE